MTKGNKRFGNIMHNHDTFYHGIYKYIYIHMYTYIYTYIYMYIYIYVCILRDTQSLIICNRSMR
jgi:hypothetical protein